MDSAPPPYIGQSVIRLEDDPLVRGVGRFVADIDFPHQLHMRVVRSMYAHGRIARIDTEQATGSGWGLDGEPGDHAHRAQHDAVGGAV